MSEAQMRTGWKRFLGEAVMIVISVYVAIVLEGMSGDRARRADAIDGLAQLRSELVLDRDEAQAVLLEQRRIGDKYNQLVAWLDRPETMPADSFGVLLNEVGFSNPTAYPRKGAWAMLSSSGLLGAVEDPELIVRIADHYENLVVRVEYNGKDYDELLNATMIGTAPVAWDRVRFRQRADMTELRSRLDYLESAWNGYYQILMESYLGQLETLIDELDGYLVDNGQR